MAYILGVLFRPIYFSILGFMLNFAFGVIGF